jgi:hypothetical protein
MDTMLLGANVHTTMILLGTQPRRVHGRIYAMQYIQTLSFGRMTYDHIEPGDRYFTTPRSHGVMKRNFMAFKAATYVRCL